VHSPPYDFVVVAHQLPVDVWSGRDETAGWRPNSSGLVAALRPVVARRHGAWVGWAGPGEAGRQPFDYDGMCLCPVTLSAREIREFEGQSNATIRPLYHDAVEHPVFDRRWRDSYTRVNRRFAHAAADLAAPGGVVWVHDYQLQLVPAMLREMRPDLLIGFFLHVSFPPVELFMQMPLRTELIRGMLGADVIGFQRPRAARNFLELAGHLLGLRASGHTLTVNGRNVTVDAFPNSIDVNEIEGIARSPRVVARAATIRAELGHPRRLLLGVDRLDSARGIGQRLTAFDELLAEGRLSPDDTVLVQVATPNHLAADHDRGFRRRVEREVGRINGTYGRVGRPVVQYLYRTVERAELVALYLAADVMLVTPLRSGMNLVAKEYVAARVDDGGALVLSEFTGAAADLTRALLVNPHDVDAVKDAVDRAASLPAGDAATRMRTMRRYLRTHDVNHWAGSFLAALGSMAATPAADHPVRLDAVGLPHR
jgi:trehalose 6-phosphate synthase